jgi:hypothetical protein
MRFHFLELCTLLLWMLHVPLASGMPALDHIRACRYRDTPGQNITALLQAVMQREGAASHLRRLDHNHDDTVDAAELIVELREHDNDVWAEDMRLASSYILLLRALTEAEPGLMRPPTGSAPVCQRCPLRLRDLGAVAYEAVIEEREMVMTDLREIAASTAGEGRGRGFFPPASAVRADLLFSP